MIVLSSEQRRRQLQFLGVTDADLERMHHHRDDLDASVDFVMETLPKILMQFPETRAVLENHSLEKHKSAVARHVRSMARGEIDDAYIDRRITVGQVHDDVKLAPHLYMSAFQLFFAAFVDRIAARDDYDKAQGAAAIKSFGKLFNLDMQLVLEAYFDSYEDTIKHLAYYDAITGYPNRALFKDRVNSALSRVRRARAKAAVLFITLGRLQTINDTFGRDTGNRLLNEAANTMAAALRGGDTLARIGGNDFAVFVNDVESDDEPARVAQRIMETLSHPYTVDEDEVTIAPNIGIALFPDDGINATALLENAELANHRGGAEGAAYRFYTPDMHTEVAEKLATETALRRALDRGEFAIHYQPQFDVATKQLIGFEALLRWYRDGTTFVGPNEFIPLAEETELIVPIGEWVLQTALEQLKQWHEAGYDELTMSVNLSPVQLGRSDLIERVSHILEQVGMEHRFLELEITENIMLNDAKRAIETLSRLKQLGIAIAIDDFGTGYSSLRYLQDLPVDRLKIDRSFVNAMTSRQQAAGIVETIITLARSLEMNITAEGVETEKQLKLLHQRGCHHAQGFLLGRPVDAKTAGSLLKTGTPA